MLAPRCLVSSVLLASLSLSASSCQRNGPVPTEPACVVIAPVSPGLASPGSDEFRVLHRGDVLQARRDGKPFPFTGRVDRQTVQHEGPTLVAGRIPLDNDFWVFASDVHCDVPVARVDFLCERMGNPAWFGARCDQALVRRITFSGDTVGFVACGEVQCPLILAGPRGTFVTRVEGLSDVRVARYFNWDLLLVTSQWGREQGHTGTDLVVMLANAGMRRLASIPIVEADTRTAGQVRWRITEWHADEHGIRVRGERATVDRATGHRLDTATVDDTWYVTPDGNVLTPSTSGR